jgi:hypothetical protein
MFIQMVFPSPMPMLVIHTILLEDQTPQRNQAMHLMKHRNRRRQLSRIMRRFVGVFVEMAHCRLVDDESAELCWDEHAFPCQRVLRGFLCG